MSITIKQIRELIIKSSPPLGPKVIVTLGEKSLAEVFLLEPDRVAIKTDGKTKVMIELTQELLTATANRVVSSNYKSSTDYYSKGTKPSNWYDMPEDFPFVFMPYIATLCLEAHEKGIKL